MNIKAYDYESAEQIFNVLFSSGLDRDDGLTEIPAASLQLIVSALEFITWDVFGENRTIIKAAKAIVENLRDQQKTREWRRERNS